MDITTFFLFLSSVVCVVHGMTIQQVSGCTSAGQYLVNAGNRCQYVHCTYRSMPYGGSGLVGIVRQCPPGTVVPRGLYTHSQGPLMNHPMAVCSERVFTPWYNMDCNMNRRVMKSYPAHVHGHAYDHTLDHAHSINHALTFDHTHAHNKVIFPQPVKTQTYVPLRRKAVMAKIYKPRTVYKLQVPTPKKLTLHTGSMLSDSPDQYTQYKRAMIYKPQKDAYSPPKYEYDIEPVAVPTGGYKANYDSEGYYSNPDAEAELAQEVRKLLPVDEEDVLTDEEASEMMREMMALGQYDEDA